MYVLVFLIFLSGGLLIEKIDEICNREINKKLISLHLDPFTSFNFHSYCSYRNTRKNVEIIKFRYHSKYR